MAVRQRKPLPKSTCASDELSASLQECANASAKKLNGSEFGDCLFTAAEKLDIKMSSKRMKLRRPTGFPIVVIASK